MRNYAFEGFVAHFAAAKWALGLRNGTRVPRGGLGVFWLQKFFAVGPYFRRITSFWQDGSLAWEIFLQEDPLFVG